MKKNLIYGCLNTLMLVGCSSNEAPVSNTTTPSSDSTSQNTNLDKVKYKPDLSAVTKNGGLGDTSEQMAKLLGDANKNEIGQFRYSDDLVLVKYQDGRVQHIDYQLDVKNKSMEMKEARDFASTIIPPDAALVKQYDKDNMQKVFVYHSKTLESLFTPDLFQDQEGNVKKGEFDVVFNHDGNKVDSMSAFLGDNP